MRHQRTLLIALFVAALPVLALVAFSAWTLGARYEERIYRVAGEVPDRPVAVVFGAGYWPDGTPSDVLKDRIEAAVDLYRAGRVR